MRTSRNRYGDDASMRGDPFALITYLEVTGELSMTTSGTVNDLFRINSPQWDDLRLRDFLHVTGEIDFSIQKVGSDFKVWSQ